MPLINQLWCLIPESCPFFVHFVGFQEVDGFGTKTGTLINQSWSDPRKWTIMDDNDRRNALISAISNGESRLAELDKERHNILAELKSLFPLKCKP